MDLRQLGGGRTLAVFATTIAFTFTATISVILRLVAKRANKTRLGLEDYSILVAQVRSGTSIFGR
jgi:hypothetical protein